MAARTISDEDATYTTVLSELTERPPPFRPSTSCCNTNNKSCVLLLFIIAAVCGVLMGLFFTGHIVFTSHGIGGGDDDDSVASNNTTIPTCDQVKVDKFGLDESPTSSPYPSNMALDGQNAVVVTNSGNVKFYSLVNDIWNETKTYFNINKAMRTPAVSLSGNVAIVGFLYVSDDIEQGDVGYSTQTTSIDGVHVYEQDSADQWKLVDILIPSAGIDLSTSMFGWSVDIDTKQSNPLIVVGAYGENSVYIFERRSEGNFDWDLLVKLKPQTCFHNFAYRVAIHENVIAVSTDCKYIVQLYEYNGVSFERTQSIQYISFDLGAISSLQMNAQTLAFSTVFGGLSIFERPAQVKDLPFSFFNF